jgi:RNA exonuclease 4
LDTFVRVGEKVTDFRTAYSGVRPDDLLTSAGAMDFGTCRRCVQEILEGGRILVGHGLENDLNVLKLNHPWHLIRDTSMYEPFMGVDARTGCSRPQKLKTLSKYHLGREIQAEEHCSIVDSTAAMDLYKSVKNEWDYAIQMSLRFYQTPLPYRCTYPPY